MGFEEIKKAADRVEKINLTVGENAFLIQQVALGQFEKHPAFAGVEIKQLEEEWVPVAIREKVKEMKCIITAFMAIKIANEVPLHQHFKGSESEIYFGGSNGTVTLLTVDKKEIGKFDLSEDNMTIVQDGEWHGVKSKNDKGSVLFGVKFMTEEAYLQRARQGAEWKEKIGTYEEGMDDDDHLA